MGRFFSDTNVLQELFSHGVALQMQLKRVHADLAANWDLPDDVRSFAARVVFALLRTADTRLKDFMMGRDEANAHLVPSAFSRLTTYNRATVLEALDVLRNNVLRDRALMRRSKTAFFHSQLLHDFGMLVHRFHDARVVEFLEYIITDHYNGIVIPEEAWMPDSSDALATAAEEEAPQSSQAREVGKQPDEMSSWSSNNRILGLLNALRPWRSTIQRDLVLLVLRECPRLAPLYFGQGPDNFFCSRFFPKDCSSSWLCVMALVKRYCEEQELPLPGPWTSELRVRELAERAVPGCPSLVQWRKCLASEYALVRYVSLDTLCAVLTRCHSQLNRTHPLSVRALDVIQKHRLPHCNLVQLLLAREKSEAKNAGSDMIIGVALRCLNLYHTVFGESEISDANWVGTLQSPWSRVPAIRQIAFTSHGWWLRGPAKDVFKMLSKLQSSNTLMRDAVLQTTESLLRDTDLFGNALFANELHEWLYSVEEEADAEVLVSTVSRIMKAVPTAKHLDAKFNQELRKFASPLLLEVAAQLYSTGGAKKGAIGAPPTLFKFLYLCRVMVAMCHHSDIPLRLLLELATLLASDDSLYASLPDGEQAKKHVSATAAFIRFLADKGGKRLAAVSGCNDAGCLGAALPSSLSDSVLQSLRPEAVLGHAVSAVDAVAPHLEAWLATGQVDERLFSQALFYIRQLPHLPADAKLCCFRVMWAALERGEGVVSVAWRDRFLTDAVVIEECLASTSPAAIMCLGECLVSSKRHEIVGPLLLKCGSLSRVAVLLRLVRWSQVNSNVINTVLRRVISSKEWHLASQIVWSAWPGVANVASWWLNQFWEHAQFRPIAAGSRNVAPPSQETVTAATNSLLSSLDLDCTVLFWALLGLVVEPSAALAKHLCRVAPKSKAVCALLALYARLYVSVAKEVAASAGETSLHLVPSLVMVGGAQFTRLTPSVLRWCGSGQLAAAWLDEWRQKVSSFDGTALVEAVPDLTSSPLAAWPQFVSLSPILYDAKLRLLLPVVSVSSPLPGSWNAVAACLLELKHVAEWGPDDVSLQVLDVAVKFPVDEAFGALRDAVQDARTDAGWVERACRVLLGGECVSAAMADIFLAMVERRPNLCTRDFLGRILTFYSGTASSMDLALLKVVRFSQKLGVDLDAVGYLWGRAGAATTSFSGSAEYLFYEGALLKDSVLIASINDFPVDRLEGSSEEQSLDLPNVYDPCFILPYFRLMLTKYEANCKRFADRGFLAYCLMACSSEHEAVRRLAYSAIQAYWLQLEASHNFSWKPQIRLLVSSFKNAVVRPLQYVPSLVAVFLANFALIVCQPSHFMYEMVNTALLRRPVFDLASVPLLRDAFLAKCDNATRRWFFQTVANGIKRGVDLKLLQEFHIIELLQSFFHHVADLEERVLVLRILQQCSRHVKVARMLDQKFGVLGWISVSVDEMLERSVACVISTNILAAWGAQASFQTRQLGWAIGVKLVNRATTTQQAEASLRLLASCKGGQSSSREVVHLIERSALLSVPAAETLAAIAASSGAGADAVAASLNLLLDSVVLVQAAVITVEWVTAAAASNPILLRDDGVKLAMRRLMTSGVLLANAKLSHSLGVFSCVVAKLLLQSPLQFEAAMQRNAVAEMIQIAAECL